MRFPLTLALSHVGERGEGRLERASPAWSLRFHASPSLCERDVAVCLAVPPHPSPLPRGGEGRRSSGAGWFAARCYANGRV